MINIAIRATYYIFCCRNRNWDSPDLMQFWFLFFSLLFFLNNPISSSIRKLPIRSEICKYTFKNTNKVSIIIIIIKYYFLPSSREGPDTKKGHNRYNASQTAWFSVYLFLLLPKIKGHKGPCNKFIIILHTPLIYFDQ